MDCPVEETLDYPALVVGQATRHGLTKLLEDNGYVVVSHGWADSSTTTWAVCLGDKEWFPASQEVAEKARELLWENGWGCVEITTIPVGV